MVIIDTDIIIDHLRQPESKTTLLRKIAAKIHKKNLAISIISVQELYEGKSTLDENKEQFLLATITPLKILPYSWETAKLAGQIARNLKRPIELGDAAIAATAIINGAEFFTKNKKDFKKIKDLKLYNP